MILIVESGATKTDWCIAGGSKTVSVKTAGMNLSTMSDEALNKIVEEALALIAKEGICPNDSGNHFTDIHFYAAGLIAPEGVRVPAQAEKLDAVLSGIFKDAKIEYASDLLAAARSVCGHKAGIAAILGTGSNSCFFDGEKIVKNVRSAGFILGDEGSGARLGRLFMSDFLKGLVPEEVAQKFSKDFVVDYMTVVKNVYGGEAPSKYLGAFAPWIMEWYESNDYVRNLVDGNFKDFIERALKQYDLKQYPVGIVGGFGYANQDKFRKLAADFGIVISTVIKAPAEGLVNYHLNIY